jgi:hypothetical protein
MQPYTSLDAQAAELLPAPPDKMSATQLQQLLQELRQSPELCAQLDVWLYFHLVTRSELLARCAIGLARGMPRPCACWSIYLSCAGSRWYFYRCGAHRLAHDLDELARAYRKLYGSIVSRSWPSAPPLL